MVQTKLAFYRCLRHTELPPNPVQRKQHRTGTAQMIFFEIQTNCRKEQSCHFTTLIPKSQDVRSLWSTFGATTTNAETWRVEMLNWTHGGMAPVRRSEIDPRSIRDPSDPSFPHLGCIDGERVDGCSLGWAVPVRASFHQRFLNL